MPADLILASASPVRARLLRAAGLGVQVIPADIDEAAVKVDMARQGKPVRDVALALAVRKALAVCEAHTGSYVVGADQILCCGDKLYDKPATLDEAAAHLKAFQGREHSLVSAAAVVLSGAVVWSHIETPKLTMRTLGEGDIEKYLAAVGKKALESVGAYQLEGPGVQLFERVEGDFFSILGLPLLPLLAFLREASGSEIVGLEIVGS